jgi:threonine dehydrogenase-like Zn-dependent dehydrogenase
MWMKSRQAMLSRPNAPFDIVESEIPALEDGQILLRQELCGVCATDAHMWKGHLPGIVYPLVLGHETIGVVADIGGNVPRVDCVGRPVSIGDRIYVVPGINCGICYFCARLHEPTLCANGTGTGFNPFPDRPWLHGGWSEYVLIDHPRQTFTKIDTLDAQAALFLEPLAVGIHALNRATVRAGDVVVIQGAGAVGMGALVAARESGAHRTIVVGGPPTRLAMARALGADETIDLERIPDPAERVEHVRALSTQGLGADLVVECTGFPTSVPEGLEMLRRGGTYVVAGHFTDRGTVVINPYAHLNVNHVTIRGSWGAEVAHFIQGLPILVSGRYDTAAIVSHRMPLSRAGDVCVALTSDYRLDGEEVRKIAIEASLA